MAESRSGGFGRTAEQARELEARARVAIGQMRVDELRAQADRMERNLRYFDEFSSLRDDANAAIAEANPLANYPRPGGFDPNLGKSGRTFQEGVETLGAGGAQGGALVQQLAAQAAQGQSPVLAQAQIQNSQQLRQVGPLSFLEPRRTSQIQLTPNVATVPDRLQAGVQLAAIEERAKTDLLKTLITETVKSQDAALDHVSEVLGSPSASAAEIAGATAFLQGMPPEFQREAALRAAAFRNKVVREEDLHEVRGRDGSIILTPRSEARGLKNFDKPDKAEAGWEISVPGPDGNPITVRYGSPDAVTQRGMMTDQLAADRTIEELRSIAQLYDRSFLMAGPQLRNWASRNQAWVTENLTPEQVEQVGKYRQFFSAVESGVFQRIHDLTGAQMSDRERAALRKITLSTDLSWPEFEYQWNYMMDMATKTRARMKLLRMRNMLPAGGWEAMSPEERERAASALPLGSVQGEMDELVEMEYRNLKEAIAKGMVDPMPEREMQVRAWNLVWGDVALPRLNISGGR